MKNHTPLRYPGGKSKTYYYIKELIYINNCKTYIEPYAGGAGVAIALLLNGDIDKIMLNDYDKAIYAVWYSILNHTDELIKLIKNTNITISGIPFSPILFKKFAPFTDKIVPKFE